MSWITAIWSATAAVCLTLAGVHLLVWVKSRTSWANLLFSIAATSAAACAVFELALMHAQTPAQFGEVLRWFHVPLAVMVVSLIWFVRQYLQSGRLWLVWLFCGMRVVTLILTFSLDPNLNFREITGLHSISAWGETIVSPIGVKNPWTNITHASGVVLLVFVADAAMAAWRQGQRRRAWVVGATFGVAILMALTLSELLDRGVLPVPYTLSLAFLVIVLGMAYELSVDLLNANRLARELRENQRRLSLATQAASLGVWEWDVVRDEIWATDTIRSRIGLREGERPNLDRFLRTLHSDDLEATRMAVRQSLEDGNELQVEYRLICASGEVRWIAARGRVERSANGKPLRVRGVSVDITERKWAEIALRESEERFRHVADAAPAMIWMAGPDKLRHYFNKGWLDYTGRSLEQELGNGWAEGVHPDDFQRCLDIYTTSFDARRNFSMQYRLRKQDGKYGWVLGIGVPRFGADGQFLGYIGSCVDITGEKEAEELHRELAHVSRVGMLGELASALAHELNQPLMAILSNAQAARRFLAAGTIDPAELRAILDDIVSDDKRAGEVIHRLRAMVQKGPVPLERCFLNDIVREVLQILNSELIRQNVLTRLELEEALPPIEAGRVEIQQVLINLVLNAVRAMKDTPPRERTVTFQTCCSEGNLILTVRDRGHGIPEEVLPHIFEPFFTTHRSGLGMGLAICRRLLEAHGGWIQAKNRPDGGAQFTVSIPLRTRKGDENLG